MGKIKIGITLGDYNGIGLEVTLKALSDPRMLQFCTPVIYGSSKIVSYHRNIVELNDLEFKNIDHANRLSDDRINVVNLWQDSVGIDLGVASNEAGKFAHISLDACVQDLKSGLLDAMVTAPINKAMMQSDQFRFQGHTEYLNHSFNVEESVMFMVNSDNLRVGVATNHIPIKDVESTLNKSLILKKIKIMTRSLQEDFGIDAPRIAVLALNPHAGDGGLIGEEEMELINPAIVELKKKGHFIMGPYPADGFFGSSAYHQFDGILAMYHDQGLIPFKALSFGNGVNYTAGLPAVRTSPDHGVGYDIAGKNMADASSMRKAIFLAIDIVKHRKGFAIRNANPLARQKVASDPDTKPTD